MFDQPIIRVCLVLGSLITATYILRRVRLAKVQIEDTIFWLLFSGILLILAIFPGIAYWAAYLLGFQSPINFVYIVIIFLLLAKQFCYVHPAQSAGQQGAHFDPARCLERRKDRTRKIRFVIPYLVWYNIFY